MPAKRKKIYKKTSAGSDLFKELWNAAVALRGSIEPADYKRYVLPLIFLRFLSLRYEQRVSEIDAEIADPQSDLFTKDKVLAKEIREDPDNFKKKNVFLVPEDTMNKPSEIFYCNYGNPRIATGHVVSTRLSHAVEKYLRHGEECAGILSGSLRRPVI
jgi:type I restriction-modification system DNA methylase subunit